MTTLFPQIKRVSEDETSKIIKNVLFSDQDECKLEQIFEEFTHLTKETITSSDVEDASDVDRDDDDDDGDDDDGDDDDDDDDEEEEDEEEEEDSGSSDDSDSSASSDDEGSGGVNHQAKSPSPLPQQASREPTSWNLDQFIKSIPVTTTTTTNSNTTTTTTTANSNTTTKTTTAATAASVASKQQAPRAQTPQAQTAQTQTPKVQTPKVQTPQAQTPQVPTPQAPTPQVPAPQTQTPQAQTPHVQTPHVQTPQVQTPQAQTQTSSGSYMVQIDLSKLKRIPGTKAPTPTTLVSSNFLLTAKAHKHEADAEKDKTKQMIKYLESAMYFVLHGYEIEQANSREQATVYYKETIPLFKHVIRLSAPDNVTNPDNMTNVKIHALALKCLSVLHARLYKSQERILHDANKTILQHSQNSPIQQVDGLLVGVKPQLFNAYKKQLAIFNELRNAHDKWHSVEHLCDQHPALRIFFSTIESNCGPLTMLSSFSKLMEHVKCGLKLLRTS